MDKTLKVEKIENGTVIDHITSGKAWEVVKILGLEEYPDTILLISNAPSKSQNKKDILKIENKELKKDEVAALALLAPSASVNIIKKYEVHKKFRVEVPKVVEGLLKCTNPVCVTHSEPVKTRFSVESKDPLKLRCEYCERLQNDIDFL